MRVFVAIGALFAIGWVIARGTLEGPFSVFNAPAAYGGSYTASHPLVLLCLVLAVGALGMWWRGGLVLPVRPLRFGLALPLGAFVLAAVFAVYPHDAWTGVWIALAVVAVFLTFVDVLGRPPAPRTARTPQGPLGMGTGERDSGNVRPPAGEAVQMPPDAASVEPPRDPPPDAGPADPPREASPDAGPGGDAHVGDLPSWLGTPEEPVTPSRRRGRKGGHAVSERRAPSRHAAAPQSRPPWVAARGVIDSATRWMRGAWGAVRGSRPLPDAAPAQAPWPETISPAEAVLAALALGGAFLAVLALRQYLSGVPTEVAWTGVVVAKVLPVRVTATLRNPNAYAALCLLFLGASGSLAMRPGHPLRMVGRISLALNALALALTFSRGGYVALVVLALVTAWLAGSERRRSWSALAAVAAPWILVALFVPGVLFRVGSIAVPGVAATSRFFTWWDVLRIFAHHPLVGAGPGAIEALYPAFFPLRHFTTAVLVTIPGGADNDLLQWLGTTGVVGFCALAAGGVVWMEALRRRFRIMNGAQRLAVAPLVGAILAIGVQGLVETTSFLLPVELVAAVLLAVVAAEAGLVRQVRLQTRYLPGIGGFAAMALVALALLRPWPAFTVYLAGWNELVAGHVAAARGDLGQAALSDSTNARYWAALADAEVIQASDWKAVGTALPAGFAASVGDDLATALRTDPWDANTWLVAASWEATEGRQTAAACAGQLAIGANPYNPSAVLWLAGELPQLGTPYAAASTALDGYATRLLPLVLAVYREHGETSVAAYQQTGTLLGEVRAAWGSAPAPAVPPKPLSAAVCKPALIKAGLPWLAL